MNKKVTIKRRQSLQDIAIQEGGSMEALFTIALQNNNISITDDNYLADLEDVTVDFTVTSEANLGDSDDDIEDSKDVPVNLIITSNTVVNKRHVNYYAGHGIKPATGITDDEVNAILPDPEGIDYWTVAEDDFIVEIEDEIIKIK